MNEPPTPTGLEASGQSGLLAQFSTMILKRFEQQSTFAQHPEAQVQVPAGWKVISGGAMANYSGAGSLLTKSMPLVVNGVPRGWIAASKNHFIPDPCVLTAYAIALYDPNDKWEVVVKEQELGAPQRNPVISAKLEDGFALVGGGAYDMFTEPGNLLVESRPSDDGKSWIAGGKDHIDASPAKIKAFAIGVRSVIFGKPTCSLKTSISFEDRSPSETVEASTGYAIGEYMSEFPFQND
ncbi:unnamed protein product [Darwinula stevensoni]|uniref:Uncharacterized protein n=1 Tax=Darwinula stevensoni TaxID=69355 RepID=A0A7R8X4L7_9CRUS|nr:unnamed protein product [Darwinula stevensoni]CAG0879145.1 unnamed protein product [Darwinula stevensoni]